MAIFSRETTIDAQIVPIVDLLIEQHFLGEFYQVDYQKNSFKIIKTSKT